MFILGLSFLGFGLVASPLYWGTCGEAESQEGNARWSKAARLTATRKKMVKGGEGERGEERGREG